jgi:hypothetical protein
VSAIIEVSREHGDSGAPQDAKQEFKGKVIQMKTKPRAITAIIATFIGLTAFASPAIATNHQLRAVEASYRARNHELLGVLRANEEAVRCEYRDSIRALNAARKDATRLCEPRRSHVLEEIRCARKDVVKKLRCDLKAVRQQHEFASRELREWRTAARLAARVQVCSANVHQTDVYRVDTYVLPQAAPNVATPYHEVIPSSPLPAPGVPTPANPNVILPPINGGGLIIPEATPVAPANELPEFGFGASRRSPSVEVRGSVVDVVSELLALLARR